MKQFIKNNLKVFVIVVITAILFTGIGVYAANTYLAHDISYTPSNENFEVSNVEDALNELYDNSNKPLILKLRTESYSSNRQGVTNYNLDATDIISKYKFFKFKLLSTTGIKSWEMYGYNIITKSHEKLNPNIEYSFTNYNNIWTIVYSQTDGNMGFVVIETEFYN